MLQTIKRRALGNSQELPNNVLRVSKGLISLSGNISERFQAGRTSNPDWAVVKETVKLGLAADQHAQQIQVLPRETDNAFSWATRSDGGVLHVSIPRDFRDQGMPIGDYVLTDEDKLIFTLAR